MITGAIIARDEERHIQACLDTLAWADERLVLVDDRTSDSTRALSSAAGARVEQRRFDDFPHQRNAALALARHDWVLFVDADERVTPELALEVQSTVAAASHQGYFIPRYNHILGKVIRHAGWYPDHQMRLLDRRHARYDDAVPVHEVVLLDSGEAGYLDQHFIHYNYDSIAQFLDKQRRYSDLEVQRVAAGGPVRRRSLLSMPAREFIRRYWALQGYRDGGHGLLLSGLMAYFIFRTYRKCLS